MPSRNEYLALGGLVLFMLSQRDDSNGGTDPNDGVTLSDVNVVSVDPSTYNVGGQYGGDITLRADVTNTSSESATAEVTYRIDGQNAFTDAIYPDAGETVESSVIGSASYFRDNYGISGSVTAEVTEIY